FVRGLGSGLPSRPVVGRATPGINNLPIVYQALGHAVFAFRHAARLFLSMYSACAFRRQVRHVRSPRTSRASYRCPRGHLSFLSLGLTPRLVFSADVTGSRWSGFTHARFRQRWSSSRPAGMGPTSSSHAARCAGTLEPSSQKEPYPWEFFPATHCQQSPISTFDQKRTDRSIQVRGLVTWAWP